MARDPETPDPGSPLVPPPIVRPCSEPPYRGRVLVVAPHPDDESVGVGGLLALHARLGDEVHALYVTTGVHGDPQRRHEPSEYVDLRRREAQAAAAVLGIATTEFWDFPDGCVVTAADLAHVSALLAGLLERLQPDVIYAPHVGESHSDHHFVARAIVDARARVAAAVPLLGYEVWSPLEPDRVVDVTETYASKVAAIRCYPSQMEHTDLLGAIEGLNRYRAILLGTGGTDGHRRAEALREVP